MSEIEHRNERSDSEWKHDHAEPQPGCRCAERYGQSPPLTGKEQEAMRGWLAGLAADAADEPPNTVTEGELRAIIRNAISLNDPAATARWMRDHLHVTRRADAR